MAEKLSTCFANKLLDTAPLKTLFSTPEIRFYSGTVPATADAAAGTVIAVVKQAAAALTWAASAVGGVLTKSATAWTDPAATGGVATYYRLLNHADDDSLDGGVIYPRIQGTVGTGAADMNLVSTTIAAGLFTVNYYQQAIVPS